MEVLQHCPHYGLVAVGCELGVKPSEAHQPRGSRLLLELPRPVEAGGHRLLLGTGVLDCVETAKLCVHMGEVKRSREQMVCFSSGFVILFAKYFLAFRHPLVVLLRCQFDS